MTRTRHIACVLTAGIAITVPLFAADWVHHPAPFAKSLVEAVVKSQPDVLDVIFHVTPPGTSDNYAVAAHTPSEQGSKSGEDDVAVMRTGKSLVEVQKDGKRIGVLVPLYDHEHRTIGSIGLMYVYPAGKEQNVFLTRSEQIRNSLAQKISSRESLFEADRVPVQ